MQYSTVPNRRVRAMDWGSLKLNQRPATTEHRCRCGTPISVGDSCFEFEGLPEALSDLLRDQAFCTISCVRAYLLEAMEVLEGAGAPDLISDVHSVYSYLQAMFALAQNDLRATGVTVPCTS